MAQHTRRLHPEGECPGTDISLPVTGSVTDAIPGAVHVSAKPSVSLPYVTCGASLPAGRGGQDSFSQQDRHGRQGNRYYLLPTAQDRDSFRVYLCVPFPDLPGPGITGAGHRPAQLQLSAEIFPGVFHASTQDGSRLAASSKSVIRFIVFFLSLPVLYWTVTVTLSPVCHCAGVFSAGRRSSKSETADA